MYQTKTTVFSSDGGNRGSWQCFWRGNRSPETGSPAHIPSARARIWHLNTRKAETCARAGAEGVIVGSAIVEIVERNLKDQDTMMHELKDYVSSLKKHLLRVLWYNKSLG